MSGTFFKVLKGASRVAHPTSARKDSFAKSHIEVRMFNVRSGEAILLVFPNKKAWVVDCGSSGGQTISSRNGKLGTALAAYLNQRNLKLEAIIPSHAHIDHGGGLRWLLQAAPSLANKVRVYRPADGWTTNTNWIRDLETELDKVAGLERVVLRDSHHVVEISEGVRAHFFAARGARAYTSVFLHLRYHDARLLFTGDVECDYEKKMLDLFEDADFRSDVLKVTHHGSSGGTSVALIDKVKPGMAIASTARDGGHRLEKDTLRRIGCDGDPRCTFETVVDGDIILLTDGHKFGDGFLYQIDFEPGRFATETSATTAALSTIDKERRDPKKKDCEQAD